MPSVKNYEIVDELSEIFSTTPVVILAHDDGLTVPQTQVLRQQVRNVHGGHVMVAKNTLMRLAVKGTSYENLLPRLVGKSVIIYGEDPVDLSKILVRFSAEYNKFIIQCASLDATMLEPNGVQKLATLPSLDALRGTLISLIRAPAAKLASLTAAPALDLARLIGAYASGKLERFDPPTESRETTNDDGPEATLDASESPSMIVKMLLSRSAEHRVEGIRKVPRFLLSLKDKEDMQATRQPLSPIDALEASTLHERLYQRVFSDDETEAREAAYALVVSLPDYRGLLDPIASAEQLTESQEEEFRVSLRKMLFSFNLYYFSQVSAWRDTQSPAKLRVSVTISRKVPFTIGDKEVFLEQRKIKSDVVYIDCPFAEHVGEATTKRPDDGSGLVAVADASMTLYPEHISNDRLPVVVTFNGATETIYVEPQADDGQGGALARPTPTSEAS